jgi:hypothetical protein
MIEYCQECQTAMMRQRAFLAEAERWRRARPIERPRKRERADRSTGTMAIRQVGSMLTSLATIAVSVHMK